MRKTRNRQSGFKYIKLITSFLLSLLAGITNELILSAASQPILGLSNFLPAVQTNSAILFGAFFTIGAITGVISTYYIYAPKTDKSGADDVVDTEGDVIDITQPGDRDENLPVTTDDPEPPAMREKIHDSFARSIPQPPPTVLRSVPQEQSSTAELQWVRIFGLLAFGVAGSVASKTVLPGAAGVIVGGIIGVLVGGYALNQVAALVSDRSQQETA